MQTISITVDDHLLQAVNDMANKLDMTLSAFMQYALQLALKRQQIRELEEQHQQGYLMKPVTEGEFSDWEGEQVWGDSCNEEKSAGTPSKSRTRDALS